MLLFLGLLKLLTAGTDVLCSRTCHTASDGHRLSPQEAPGKAGKNILNCTLLLLFSHGCSFRESFAQDCLEGRTHLDSKMT
jgi:hypothetical protein